MINKLRPSSLIYHTIEIKIKKILSFAQASKSISTPTKVCTLTNTCSQIIFFIRIINYNFS